ncbi:N-acetyltransferase B complex non catalytic subunit-domain-containing protein [Epithele typhae]|uniref:N-acetyltransferase B complex non catalytic subunit-domain-containing protein n=1 Tax=Epithele typhae TaxID=378194 RepID=UPI002007355B|nr:N-acetyltransferase B complex non catalytic subunit-domain-containing protein [Epithele typhae]KAH9946109.1 N-acetyltransferase B complex non catalytic subunit-domain-containing protein [Epithele typhae]
MDRQIRPIYEALDTGSNKSAILACNKILKKQPTNQLVKALKTLALVRSQKVEEALIFCDEILASKPSDDATLSAMMHVLRGLGRHLDMVTMYEDAYKQQPGNEEMGQQTFFANARIGNWKAAQQIATKLHKQFQEDLYLYWCVMSTYLQAKDPATPANLRAVLFKLAHRLLSQSPNISYYNADRFHLHVTVLKELELYDEAFQMLEHDGGKLICSLNLSCEELRKEIWKLKGLATEEGARAEKRIVEVKDRNWLEFLSVLDATFCDVPVSGSEDAAAARASCEEQIARARELFSKVVEEDGVKDRAGHLALLELEQRARQHGLSNDPSALTSLMESYFATFGGKACCYEDLKPYVGDAAVSAARWTTYLEAQPASVASIPDIWRHINAQKLLRYTLAASALTPEAETRRAVELFDVYLQGLSLGKDLPSFELQPVDDLVILAAEIFVNSWKLSGDEAHLYNAAALLEYAIGQSKMSYQIRLHLIQIYRLLGAPSLAVEHYRGIKVKQVQNDTLSHFILSRASTFSLSSIGDLTFTTECLESSRIYLSNSEETAEFIVRAFGGEKYSQIPDIITFEERLDNSLQRDLVKMEHVRMRVAHEALNSELIDMELIELKFIFDRSHHDNRDFDILANYQPRASASFNDQTQFAGKIPGLGWLSVFLKIYIRAFQMASDLDDTVEDKLLIGDRPKPSYDPNTKLPLKERLVIRKEEELGELSATEVQLYDFASALSEWLTPYHDYARPPPSAVLAEAAKLTEQKTGHTLKNLELPPEANGNGKKDEEPPTVVEPPTSIAAYFDDMLKQIKEAFASKALSSELLHLVTLAQEAFLLFAIETVRFKTASVVKQNKFGALSQYIKEIRAKSAATLTEISAELVKSAEADATADSRAAIVAACKPIIQDSGLDHDFVLNVAKKITDSRKQILDGVGKGIVKLCKTHA